MDTKINMEYPKPSITADIIAYDPFMGKILLIQRKNEPYKGKWAFPGGFFNPQTDISIAYAAARELFEETNIDVSAHSLKFFRYYDDINRDERDRVVTFVYIANIDSTKHHLKAKDDALNLDWCNPRNMFTNAFAFDHSKIIFDFLKKKL